MTREPASADEAEASWEGPFRRRSAHKGRETRPRNSWVVIPAIETQKLEPEEKSGGNSDALDTGGRMLLQ